MIDRYGLVTRHNPVYTNLKKDAPLSVGNGTFCFTADFTGLQTFFDAYAAPDDGFPLCTMAEWGWHSYPDGAPDASGLRLTHFDTYGREVGYAVDATGQEELFRALRQNPHKFHLGKIGFALADEPLTLDTCKAGKQTLNLWEGFLHSEWMLGDIPVVTETLVHPFEDTLYMRVTSSLVSAGKLHVALHFPYGSHQKSAADFTVPRRHTTVITHKNTQSIGLERMMDGTRYQVTLGFTGLSMDTVPGIGSLPAHTLLLMGQAGGPGT
ncbi:MAG: hypothetical protein LBK43_05960, partial [Treponema sp.]|nr:hypothetical protein [Treponema sp.]